MANLQKKIPENVNGEFFVDSTCIDCDACRQIAPETFADAGDNSYVFHQPQTESEQRNALRALLCCPVGCIGTVGKNGAKEVMADFPLRLNEGEPEEVYYCGFNSPDSFGGNSYFIRHPGGNWLVDSPKFLPHLTGRMEALGGLRYIFLTHRDDVADAEQFARHFGAERIIHREELSAQPDAEIVIDGFAPVQFSPEFRLIPTPGHTRGHSVLLYAEKYLFTGDHLWWDRDTQELGASQTFCWYSWPEQKKSMRRLAEETFSWVLPGHGDRVGRSPARIKEEMQNLLGRIGA